MNKRRSLLAAAATLLVPNVALATDYYVSDCQSGADANCVAGNDSNAGTSPQAPWRTYGKASAQFGSIAAGDRILFARGGSFVGDEEPWANASCTTANPCTIADYTPPWASGDEGAPILSSAGARFIHFTTGGGYVLKNLELRGLGDGTSSNWAVFIDSTIDGLEIDNMVIHDFDIGVYPYNPAPKHVTFKNSRVIDNRVFGYLGGLTNGLIENNDFENNGTEPEFDHNIYFSYGTDTVIRGNELYKSDMHGTGACQGTSLVVHGQSQRLTVEGNYVHEDLNAAGGGCWGIALVPGYDKAEDFTGSIIRGNLVVNVGNAGIAAQSCPDCVIEDNVIVQEQPFGSRGIAFPAGSHSAEDVTENHATVRNNSVFMSTSSKDASIGIAVDFVDGANHVVVGNAVSYAGSSADFFCFDFKQPFQAYQTIDNNLCHFVGTGHWVYCTYQTLEQWQSATSFDEHSILADPLFKSPAAPNHDLSLLQGSPAIDASHATLSSPTDFDGHPRDAKPDIGAFEYGSQGGGGSTSVGTGGSSNAASSSVTSGVTSTSSASTGAGGADQNASSSASAGGGSNSANGNDKSGCTCRVGTTRGGAPLAGIGIALLLAFARFRGRGGSARVGSSATQSRSRAPRG